MIEVLNKPGSVVFIWQLCVLVLLEFSSNYNSELKTHKLGQFVPQLDSSRKWLLDAWLSRGRLGTLPSQSLNMVHLKMAAF